MPRRSYKKRTIAHDPIYDSFVIAKLINLIMDGGKKTVASAIVYGVLEEIKKEKKIEPTTLIDTAVENVAPVHIVRPRRVGGASYMVPREVTPHHRVFLALRWLVDAARARNNKEYSTFHKKLKAELMDAFEKKGSAYDKKTQSEKLAEANKVFAHFNW